MVGLVLDEFLVEQLVGGDQGVNRVPEQVRVRRGVRGCRRLTASSRMVTSMKSPSAGHDASILSKELASRVPPIHREGSRC